MDIGRLMCYANPPPFFPQMIRMIFVIVLISLMNVMGMKDK
jgi:hypothetical protein